MPQTLLQTDAPHSLDECVDTKTAARVLGVKVATLEKWRALNQPPRWVRVGRLCRYKKSELARFLAGAERGPAA
ncbi:MAG: helix-turn-helix domain-containing protein [Gemmatimonadota bacterium]